ncbi:MAG: bifunctional demethylmenaquinone methyltransferase/2-methoxy-6-polyprenyl-1,4-benzoquinol methylase UbiE [Bacteroidota bacterium]|nr:bifunctional demethylmenaquinone methyltransferase/2-methoxy-6-polyprenyl-1,4-benzoquinol methylase UbiE [Bacteroidota bacterium]MDP4211727.1 bifunctional demethylmenaquinone methyltransferase/2-methoxy-6-polyprenyl-1,4-benzoquinol methylase UbiE [Bacteroidota bacterium]MDP4250400.1 bifunctional demethylmenaquinone methyltransferase/2-methoxy-6-polyprenyl-1,4-benzoquinol methylase UbiE [Bacteroidota bacterium]
MAPYQHDSIVPFKDSSRTKKQQVAEMFDKIASRYDFLNHFLSGGVDKYWRSKAIRELESIRPAIILDVATGTGDLAIRMARQLRPERIVGIDISSGMLELGNQKIAKLRLKPQITLQEGDSEAINFPGASFEAVTVAFGVRNFQNLEKGLQEMHRVLKPEGKLVILEFSKPRKGPFLKIYKIYLRYITPRIGKMLSGNLDAYQYLNDSVNAFPEGDVFTEILKKTGFINTYSKKLSLGICTIYCGTKES